MNKLTICKNLFEDWNSSGVVYCHWKGTANIEKGFTGASDMDIFVDPKDNEKAASFLEKNNFIRFYTQWGLRYPFIQDWLGLDEETGTMVHVHYHNRMIVGHTGVMEYRYPWENDVLATRVYDESAGIYVINPEYELFTFYTRLGLEFPNKKLKRIGKGKYEFNEEAQSELSYLSTIVDTPKLMELIRRYYAEDSDQFYTFLSSPKLEDGTLKRYSRLTKRHVPHDGIEIFNKLKSFFCKACMMFYLPRQKSIFTKKIPYSKRGLTIAFVGQDGSGKSTVTRDIKKWLSWKIENRLYYMGVGEQYQPLEQKLQNRIKNNRTGFVVKLLRSWLPFKIMLKRSKDSVKYIGEATKYSKRGGIAIYDRYPQNDVQGINDGPKIRSGLLPLVSNPVLRTVANWYANREEKNVKKATQTAPDLVIQLVLSVDETLRRKPGENVEAVQKKHEIVKSLHYGSNKEYQIDASQPYDIELTQIKKIIWDNIPR